MIPKAVPKLKVFVDKENKEAFVLRNEQAPEMVAEHMEFGLYETRADALAALRSMHRHSTTSGAVRLADFLAVMDSLCSGEGGAAFHTRLRGACHSTSSAWSR